MVKCRCINEEIIYLIKNFHKGIGRRGVIVSLFVPPGVVSTTPGWFLLTVIMYCDRHKCHELCV